MRQQGHVKKAWGYEYIFATNDLYCGKIMHFDKAGSKFSMHFHQHKDETWFINKGSFKLIEINPADASVKETVLLTGASHRNLPCYPHQVVALEDDSEIFEVSTPDSVEDNYRVLPGDSQR